MTLHANYTSAAALIGDPVRALMLNALLDGRALPAGELAFAAGVTPQTASSHLHKLLDGGLLEAEREGRHRYYASQPAVPMHSGHIAQSSSALRTSSRDCACKAQKSFTLRPANFS